MKLKVENDFLRKEKELHNTIIEKKISDLQKSKLGMDTDEEQQKRRKGLERTNDYLKKENELLHKKYEGLFSKNKKLLEQNQNSATKKSSLVPLDGHNGGEAGTLLTDNEKLRIENNALMERLNEEVNLRNQGTIQKSVSNIKEFDNNEIDNVYSKLMQTQNELGDLKLMFKNLLTELEESESPELRKSEGIHTKQHTSNYPIQKLNNEIVENGGELDIEVPGDCSDFFDLENNQIDLQDQYQYNLQNPNNQELHQNPNLIDYNHQNSEPHQIQNPNNPYLENLLQGNLHQQYQFQQPYCQQQPTDGVSHISG